MKKPKVQNFQNLKIFLSKAQVLRFFEAFHVFDETFHVFDETFHDFNETSDV